MAHEIEGPAWIPAFLAALAETGKVGQSIEAAGITPNSAYFRRKTNRAFAEAWEAALRRETPAPGAAGGATGPLPARNAGWRTIFLETLAETSNVRLSAVRANVPLKTVYKTRRADGAFATRWLAALREGYDNLEIELLGYLRDPAPGRKMDVAAALRLLAAHRETVERQRALMEEEDEQAVLDSIDRFIDDMRERREANAAIPIEATPDDRTERETENGDGAE